MTDKQDAGESPDKLDQRERETDEAYNKRLRARIAALEAALPSREFLLRVRAAMVGIEIPMGRLSEFTTLARDVNAMLAARPEGEPKP